MDYCFVKMIVLPGGRLGVENLNRSDLVRDKLVEFGKNKMVAAVCAAPSILANLNLMKKATVHPDFKDKMGGAEVLDDPIVVDKNIITGQGLGATIPFSLKLVETMVGKEKAEQIKKAICYRE